MKVYERLVLDWDGNVLEEVSYEYDGPVAQCGGGSGGGGSGKVDYPGYMKDKHSKWLNEVDYLITHICNPFAAGACRAPTIELIEDVRDLNAYGEYVLSRISQANNVDYVANFYSCPWSPQFYKAACGIICSMIDYHNDTLESETNQYRSAIQNFEAIVTTRLAELQNISGLEGTFDLETVVLPRFEAGMRDLNAVQMSSFVIGRAVIEGTYRYKIRELQEQLKQQVFAAQAEIAKHLAQLELQKDAQDKQFYVGVYSAIGQLASVAASQAAASDDFSYKVQSFVHSMRAQIMQLRQEALNSANALASDFMAKRIEWGRLATTARFEQKNMMAEFDEKGARWYLENYQYGANMLAGIGGGTVMPDRRTSRTGSSLAGALSGAAAGAMAMSGMTVGGMAGGPVGALLGGVVGLAGSLL